MKRTISVVAAVLLVFSALVLAACGGGESTADLSASEYVGSWKSTGMTMGDESEEFGYDVDLILEGDGTGQMIAKDETSDFTWSPVDDGFKTKGGVNATFVEDGDNIKTTIMGVDLVFERQ